MLAFEPLLLKSCILVPPCHALFNLLKMKIYIVYSNNERTSQLYTLEIKL